jgi:hypothetical protein
MGQEMTMRRLALLALFGSTSWAAHAADKVVYQPVPGWVKPAPAIDTAKITNDSPVLLVWMIRSGSPTGRCGATANR